MPLSDYPNDPAEPTTPNVLIDKTEDERNAMLASKPPIDRAYDSLRARSAPLTALLCDWGFRDVSDAEQPAMVNLLRGKDFGEEVSDVKPILVHKVAYNDASETATVTQPFVLSLVTSHATGQSAIMFGYLTAVEPVIVPKLDARGLTTFSPLTGAPETMVKRKGGRVVYNYDWRVMAVRPITEEDVADDGLFSLASAIGEEFADLLIDPVADVVEETTPTGGGIDYSAVTF